MCLERCILLFDSQETCVVFFGIRYYNDYESKN